MDVDPEKKDGPVLPYRPVGRYRSDFVRVVARVLSLFGVLPLGLLGLYVGLGGVGGMPLVDRCIALGLGVAMIVFVGWFLWWSFRWEHADRERLE